jgi:hypothetical protein
MSESRYEDRIGQLRDELKALEERGTKAEADKEKIKAKIKDITLGTRVHDRHLWLVWWANVTTRIFGDFRPTGEN